MPPLFYCWFPPECFWFQLLPYSQKTSQSNHTRTTALSNSMKLSHAWGATQDGRVMLERSDRIWPTGEGNGKPLQYSWLENPMRSSVQLSSVAQSCPTLCDPMDCSILVLPAHHQLPEFTQTHVHWVRDAIQPSHPLSSTSPTFHISQHQGLFNESVRIRWPKYWEFQLQCQSFQWIFRTDLL